MTFYTYMMRNYLTEASAKGDLARDIKRDGMDFPKNRSCKFNRWHGLIHDYLEKRRACSACYEAFEECWEEYVECEKKRLNRN